MKEDEMPTLQVESVQGVSTNGRVNVRVTAIDATGISKQITLSFNYGAADTIRTLLNYEMA
jgi:hypothetical protein